MKFDVDYRYLSGTEIHNGALFDFYEPIADSRLELISKIVQEMKGARIVHLGACDHVELIEKKIKNDSWLHKRISENSGETIGFDINADAVQYCNKLGWYNIFHADMTRDIDFVHKKLGMGGGTI